MSDKKTEFIKPVTEFFKLSKINFDNLTFLKTKQNNGKKFINTVYDKNPWGLKLPSMEVNFDTTTDKYGNISLTLSLGGNEKIISKLNELDSALQGFAEENGWTDGTEKYNPIVKGQLGGRYPQYLSFKFKSDRDTGFYSTSFYKKEDGVTVPVQINTSEELSSFLPRGTPVLSSIEAVGIWFMNNQWGLSFKIGHVLITDKKVEKNAEVEKPEEQDTVTDGYMFEESSDSSISDEGEGEEEEV
jgi:hypothetical protein